jgi:hypothetical protein
MWRTIIATVAGYLAWWAVGIGGFLFLRDTWPDYAAVERALTFTLGMMFSRLGVGVLCGLVAGTVIGLITRRRTLAPWIVGIVILAQFLPTHIRLWEKLPPWYHLFFLLTLVPLIVVASRLVVSWLAAGPRATAANAPA